MPLIEGFWNNDNSFGFFTNFNANQEKYSLLFQLFAQSSRFKALEKAKVDNPEAYTFISERSVDDDYFIFAKLLNEKGFISRDEMLMLEEFRKAFNFNSNGSMTVLVEASSNVCFQRLHERGRSEEVNISSEYLVNLERVTREYWQKLNREGRCLYHFTSIDINSPLYLDSVNELVEIILAC